MHAVRLSDKLCCGLSTDLTIEQVMMEHAKTQGGLTHGRGLTESVRLTWAKSMHVSAAVHEAVICLLDLDKGLDESHHVETGASRVKRDASDLQKVLCWLEANSPFDTNDARLRSLSTGIVYNDGSLNCDNADNVGCLIMKSMDDVSYADVTIKKADKLKTIDEGLSGGNGNVKKIEIDSNVLFTQLIVLMKRTSNLEPYFSYELTPFPTSMFKQNAMRKSAKAQLTHELLKYIECHL
jgi:hypothetical protein